MQQWFHGSISPTPVTVFERRPKPAEYGARDFNTNLGPHFTTLHDVARDFAAPGGTVHHATLTMTNPRHYEDEWDLDREAWHWAKQAGYTGLGDTDEGPFPMLDLRGHHDAAAIADGFLAHLRGLGHDGITYGNRYEEPVGHLCAIAINPATITLTGHHSPGSKHTGCPLSARAA